MLAVALVLIAVGVYLPARRRRALVLALVVAAVIWVVGEALGVLPAAGTDPNSGPLLALIALAYWPVRTAYGTGATAGRQASTKGRPRETPDWIVDIFAAIMLVAAVAPAAWSSPAWRHGAHRRRTTSTSRIC